MLCVVAATRSTATDMCVINHCDSHAGPYQQELRSVLSSSGVLFSGFGGRRRQLLGACRQLLQQAVPLARHRAEGSRLLSGLLQHIIAGNTSEDGFGPGACCCNRIDGINGK